MPTVEQNKIHWGDSYDWNEGGEEWSTKWGTSCMQWYGTILPRIHAFLPADTILEIAPGYGRWTEFLKDFCSNLIIVDLSKKCINACQERFAGCSNITYFINDGMSLEMIPDNSIDFIFSFDSLVHAEDTIISAYISQFAKKLKPDGAAFIHHSNLGDYAKSVKMQHMISKIPKLSGILMGLGILDDVCISWRAPSMTARKIQLYAEENDLQCINQELITWNTTSTLIDCMSTIVKKNSIWARENKVFKNEYFMEEARNLSILSQLYDFPSRK